MTIESETTIEITYDGDFRWQDPPRHLVGERARQPSPAVHFGKLRGQPRRWARLRKYRSPQAARAARAHLRGDSENDGIELLVAGCELYGRALGRQGGEGSKDA